LVVISHVPAGAGWRKMFGAPGFGFSPVAGWISYGPVWSFALPSAIVYRVAS
jgi:hypothetical protein